MDKGKRRRGDRERDSCEGIGNQSRRGDEEDNE